MEQIAIQIKQLTKTYRNGNIRVEALRGISLDVHEKDFLMITGRNGSGKSTFMHQIALLDTPDSGTIEFANLGELSKLPERKRIDIRLRHIGYVFQEYALIGELTALENVMLPGMLLHGAKEAKQRAIKLLEKVELTDKMRRLPSQLSGGEQQRVAIARSMINSPQIIFADEPTANLDTIASEKVLDIFKKINQEGTTIVMITHEQEELAYSNRHVVFSDGELQS